VNGRPGVARLPGLTLLPAIFRVGGTLEKIVVFLVLVLIDVFLTLPVLIIRRIVVEKRRLPLRIVLLTTKTQTPKFTTEKRHFARLNEEERYFLSFLNPVRM
jgi:hypothetical protein